METNAGVHNPNPQAIPRLLKTCEGFGWKFFCKAVRAAGLESTLNQDGPWTLLVPSDEAFFGLPPGTLKQYLTEPRSLNNLIRRHVLSAKLKSEEIRGLQQVRSLKGGLIPVSCHRSLIRIGGVLVVDADIEAANGVIHSVDAVIPDGEDFK